MKNNPFPFSDDNKRYLTFNYYGKQRYGRKIVKIPLDGPFSCPNRDGTKSHAGCLFCMGGSDGFPDLQGKDLLDQYALRKAIFDRKWPNGVPFAYFQSYSNTYGSLEKLQEVYAPFVKNPEIAGLVIATRPDCLDAEKVAYLNQLAQKREVWLELGLQSIHDQTLKEMNRGHDYQEFLDALQLMENTNLKICVHLINGWPSETREQMIESAKALSALPIHGVKIHMLHICQNTPLAALYDQKPFELLSQSEYVEIVAQQLAWLRSDIIIERVTGDGLKDSLIAPEWTLKKTCVINDLDKWMEKADLWQGKHWETLK